MLADELGSVLNTKEVAEYLGVDEKTVRRYAPMLGGIRIGKNWKFFERRVIDAVLRQEQKEMDSPGNEEGQEKAGNIPDDERSQAIRGKVSETTDEALEQTVRDDLRRMDDRIPKIL